MKDRVKADLGERWPETEVQEFIDAVDREIAGSEDFQGYKDLLGVTRLSYKLEQQLAQPVASFTTRGERIREYLSGFILPFEKSKQAFQVLLKEAEPYTACCQGEVDAELLAQQHRVFTRDIQRMEEELQFIICTLTEMDINDGKMEGYNEVLGRLKYYDDGERIANAIMKDGSIALLAFNNEEIAAKVPLEKFHAIMQQYENEGYNQKAGQRLLVSMGLQLVFRFSQKNISSPELPDYNMNMQYIFEALKGVDVLAKELEYLKNNYYAAILETLYDAIRTKLATTPKNTTPWQLGWLGSRAKIALGKDHHVSVPRTIKAIYDDIEKYRDLSGNKKTLAVTEALFNKVKTKLEANTANWGFLGWLAKVFRALIGRGRSEETTATYKNMLVQCGDAPILRKASH